jgi:hypothetical protein
MPADCITGSLIIILFEKDGNDAALSFYTELLMKRGCPSDEVRPKPWVVPNVSPSLSDLKVKEKNNRYTKTRQEKAPFY